MGLSIATDVDIDLCIADDQILITLEGIQTPSNAPIAWDGTEFSGAKFPSFDAGDSFPPMTIDGRLKSLSVMEITITVGAMTSTFDVEFTSDDACLI